MGSRVAKNPVVLPEGVTFTANGNTVIVKGKLGELSLDVHSTVAFDHADGQVTFRSANDAVDASAMAGTMRSLVNNMVQGVSQGFEKKLTLIGVGYRAQVQGDVLDLTVGLSHPMKMKMPDGVKAATPQPTEIVLSGVDKQKVAQVAANVRAVRPPEPYKGKGIRYADEHVSLKEGKKK